MYAIIESGGKQYRVELGSRLEIDRLDVEPGQTIEFDRVLLISDGNDAAIGRPVVEGARVSADVVEQGRGEKLVVFKYRPKARRRVKHGHRSELTIVRIADIVHDGRSAARAAESERAERDRAAAEAAQAAERQAAADRALADRLAQTQAPVTADAGTDADAGARKPGRRTVTRRPRVSQTVAATDDATDATTSAAPDETAGATRDAEPDTAGAQTAEATPGTSASEPATAGSDDSAKPNTTATE